MVGYQLRLAVRRGGREDDMVSVRLGRKLTQRLRLTCPLQ
jgi:hypothetical protein